MKTLQLVYQHIKTLQQKQVSCRSYLSSFVTEVFSSAYEKSHSARRQQCFSLGYKPEMHHRNYCPHSSDLGTTEAT